MAAKRKSKTSFECRSCGTRYPQWSGQCSACGQWNTLVEFVAADPPGGAATHEGWLSSAEQSVIVEATEVAATPIATIPTGITELDRVLGRGLVPGSVVLMGGDPGVGKSTLALQALSRLAAADHRVLYVSGEESLEQLSSRARRLELAVPRLSLLTETQMERVLRLASEQRPAVMVVDSIQTVFTEALGSAPGSVSQVRECAAQLTRFAKALGITVVVIGHVTKEGAIAGPRVLEHMVDAVLYFESESDQRFRLVRAVKNRFGAVNELGLFAMSDRGLKEVNNPSAIFLSKHAEPVAGTVVTVTRQGTRPLLVELQALVDESQPMGSPRRLSVGPDPSRLPLLLAVLHRHGRLATAHNDVFINMVGGVRVDETSVDLPTLLAITSSLSDRPIPRDWVVFGEVGLTGEVRPVPRGEERVVEAAKHGFKRALVPLENCPRKPVGGMDVLGIKRLTEALAAVEAGP